MDRPPRIPPSPTVGEDRAPLAEGQVAGHRDRGPFLPLGDDLEQQLGPSRVEMDIAELVETQQALSLNPGVGSDPCA
jgi:hypothetical protein